MVREGELAPDFEAVAHDGSRVRLSDLRGGKWVVLYFFPKAFTPGCTREARSFSAEWGGEFRKMGGVEVMGGVSRDDPATLARFAEAEGGAGFKFISDQDGSVAKAYGGVLGMLGGMADRVTFVIDPEGKVAGVVKGFSVRPDQHPEAALRVVTQRARQQ